MERQEWLRKALVHTPPRAQQTYQAQKGWSLDQVAAAALKQLARCSYQLKVGHATVAAYLCQIGAQGLSKYQTCQALQRTVGHLLVDACSGTARGWPHTSPS
jgi:hypothetical protein